MPVESTAFRPTTLREALSLRSETGGTLYAGGTDLMVRTMRWGGVPRRSGRPVIFIGHLKEIQGVRREGDFLVIGACSTLVSLQTHPEVPSLMKRIIGVMASPAVRNMATIGGNVCNASPAGDTLPYLYALNGTVLCESAEGQREVPVSQFISGPGTTVLADNEIVTGIRMPCEAFPYEFHRKVAVRRANSLTKASVLGLAKKENGRLIDLRLAFGAVGPTVIRSEEYEQALRDALSSIGGPPEKEPIIRDVLFRYSELLRPIDDQRSTADYRRAVVIRLAAHFLKTVLAG